MAADAPSPVVCKVKFASLDHLHRVVLTGADKSVKLREEVLRLCAQNKLGPDVTLTYADNKDQVCVISNLSDLENALSFSSVKGLTVKVTVHHLPQPVCQLNFPHWPGHTYLVGLTESAQLLSEADPDRLWARLLEECVRLYKLKTDSAAPLSASAFTLTFLDEEGDCCLMSCAAELQEALELASINRMPLKVFAAESKDCQLDVSPRPAAEVKEEATPGADVPSAPATPLPVAEPAAAVEEEESESDAESEASESEQPSKPEDEESFSECETSEDEDGWLLEEYGGNPFDRKPVVRRSNQPKPGRGPRPPRSATLPTASVVEPVSQPAVIAPAPVASPPLPISSPAPAPVVASPVSALAATPVVVAPAPLSSPAPVLPNVVTVLASPPPAKFASFDAPKMAPSPAALPAAEPVLVSAPSNDAPLVPEVPAEVKSPVTALLSLSVQPAPQPSAPPASVLHNYADPVPSAPALPAKAPAAPVPAADEANGTALLDALDYIACVRIGAPELFPAFSQYIGEYKLSGNVVVLRNRMMWLLRSNDDLRNGFEAFLNNHNKVPFEALGLEAKLPKDPKDARSALDCGVLFRPGVPLPAAPPAVVPAGRRSRRNRNKRRVHFDVPNQPHISANNRHYPAAQVNFDLPQVSFGGDRSPARVSAPAANVANPPVLDLSRFNKWYSKVSQLQAMGFSCPAHDPNFLVDLIEAVNGDVDKAIDILAADK